MVKLNCKATTGLNILRVFSFYAENNCHPTVEPGITHALMIELIKNMDVDVINNSCELLVEESDCPAMLELLSFYKKTIADSVKELTDILDQLCDAEWYPCQLNGGTCTGLACPFAGDCDSDVIHQIFNAIPDDERCCDLTGYCAGRDCKDYYTCQCK